MPRIQKFAPSAPGSPDDCTEITPAILPANDEERFVELSFSDEGLTLCTAPTSDSFFWMPKPTTTTSSSVCALSTSVTTFSSSGWSAGTFLVS